MTEFALVEHPEGGGYALRELGGARRWVKEISSGSRFVFTKNPQNALRFQIEETEIDIAEKC